MTSTPTVAWRGVVDESILSEWEVDVQRHEIVMIMEVTTRLMSEMLLGVSTLLVPVLECNSAINL